MKKAPKVPKHVQGTSLGGGPSRANPKSDGCAVTAIAFVGGVAAIGAVAATEIGRVVFG